MTWDYLEMEPIELEKETSRWKIACRWRETQSLLADRPAKSEQIVHDITAQRIFSTWNLNSINNKLLYLIFDRFNLPAHSWAIYEKSGETLESGWSSRWLEMMSKRAGECSTRFGSMS